MVDIPGFCDTCGAAFRSGLEFENCRNVTFSNNRLGPCRKCGGTVMLVTGTFNIVGDALQVLAAPQRTVDDLQKLAAILERAKRTSASADEIAASIQREVPELSSIRDLLPKKRAELYAFLALLLAATNTIISARCSPQSAETEININVAVEQSIQNIYKQESQKAASDDKAASDEKE